MIFLELAGRDIEAARLLLQNGLYPHSVFFVEQSVEKAVKSLGLWRKSITLDEAYGFRHEALKLFRRIWKKLTAFARDTVGDAEIRIELDKWESDADRLFVKLERWLKDEKWLKLSRETFSLSKPLEYIENSYTKMTVELKTAENRLRALGGERDSENQREQIRKLNSRKRVARLGFCFTYLIHMCLVFLPHVSRARYPYNNWNPLGFYNQRAPVIKLAGEFIEYQEKGLAVIKSLYDEVSGLQSAR
jgi:HEPN domain-containing protein